MARTQRINYGNAIALPVTAGSAYTPVPNAVAGVVPTKAANELVPDRPYNRVGMWVKNLSAVNSMNIVAPSGSSYPLDPGATFMVATGGGLEDGAYTITGTAADTFSFWEAY